jgi:hypothetical protein
MKQPLAVVNTTFCVSLEAVENVLWKKLCLPIQGELYQLDANSSQPPMYEDLVPLVNPTTSLLSTRRPSWTPSLPLDLSDRRLYRNETLPSQELSDLPHSNADFSSPDGGGTFRRSLQIDMKSLVGDAVGSVSPRVFSLN